MSIGLELHNASYSYENVPGGRDIVFHDPFLGVALNVHSVPPSIARQPHLLNGINHLSQIGQENGHTITLAGASHSAGSEFDMAELIGLVEGHDAIFLESIGHTDYHRKIVKEVGEGRSELPDDFLADRYKTMQLAAISRRRKFVAYGDIPGDGTAYESALIQWGSLARPLTERARVERDAEMKEDLYRAALINIAGSTIFREWQMLGAIGNNIKIAQKKGLAIDKSLILIGTEHTRTLPKKLGLIGVASSITELTMHNQGTSLTIACEEFDFTTAVRDYRARLR
jgi:hypothetical protein